jgi:hypothetical protein
MQRCITASESRPVSRRAASSSLKGGTVGPGGVFLPAHPTPLRVRALEKAKLDGRCPSQKNEGSTRRRAWTRARQDTTPPDCEGPQSQLSEPQIEIR